MKRKIIISAFGVIIAAIIFVSGCGGKGAPGGNPGPSVPEIPNTTINLAENGSTSYKIILPSSPLPIEEYAAQELKQFFYEATGAVLPVELDSVNAFSQNSCHIALGATIHKAEAGLSTGRTELNLDGYKIKRFGETVIIAGYEGRGTLYGVYSFLRHQFGFRVYAEDEIALNKTRDAVYLKDFDLVDKPCFEGRSMDGPTAASANMAARMRMKTVQMSLSSNFDGGYLDEWIGMPYHTLRLILPPSIYNNPENSAQYNPGWYQYAPNQICLTYGARTGGEDTLLNEFVEQLKKQILAYPKGFIISLGEEDMGGYCACATCKTDAANYTQSGVFIRFANKVIERIESWRAVTPELADREDFQYVLFAYNVTMTPPVNFTGGKYVPKDSSVIPHEKLYIRYTPIVACYSHSFFDEDCSVNKVFAQAFKGWQALTNNFMVWDYDVDFSNYFAFFDNYNVLQDVYIHYYENGVVNMLRESSSGSHINSMGDMDAFLNAELMWNVYADVPSLVEEFMDNYYKAGAPYMKEYFNYIRLHLAKTERDRKAAGKELHFGMSGGYYLHDTLSAQVWTKQVLENALSLFEKAYAAYDKMEDKELAQKLKLRVLKEDLCTRYLVLKNYSSYYNINSAKYLQEIDRFEADARILNATVISETNNTFSWLDSLRAKVL